MKWQVGNFDLLTSPTRREVIIFITVLIFGAIGFLRAYYFPNVKNINTLKDQENALVLQRDQLGKLMKIPQAVSEKISSKQHPGYEQYIYGSEKEIRSAFEQWTRPRLLRGIKITGSKLSDVVRQGQYLRMSVEINVEGSFVGLGRYIEVIEKPPTPLSIETIDMTPLQKGSSKVRTIIKGSVYGKAS
jgi:Tfp pilus assembly protein PilO